MSLFFGSEEKEGFLRNEIEDLSPSSVFVLTDQNTDHLCLPEFKSKFLDQVSFHHISIPAGEIEKNIKTCTRIWKEMIFHHADRNALLINLGGGVITDVGGFVASLYKRGCHFIHIPTTLLGMVDAAIGGKNGVDLGYLKNIIGVVQKPKFTYIHTHFLNTLSRSELESGWAELIKHALIADAGLWDLIKSLKKLSIPEHDVLKRAVLIKDNIVKQDPYEKSIRKTLNYGHTVGHAIESLLLANKAPVKHGHAIAIGMIIENIIAVNKGHLAQGDAVEIENFITQHYSSILDIDPHKVVRNMLHDKKNVNKEIRLALITKIGSSIHDVSCSENEALIAIEQYLKRKPLKIN